MRERSRGTGHAPAGFGAARGRLAAVAVPLAVVGVVLWTQLWPWTSPAAPEPRAGSGASGTKAPAASGDAGARTAVADSDAAEPTGTSAADALPLAIEVVDRSGIRLDGVDVAVRLEGRDAAEFVWQGRTGGAERLARWSGAAEALERAPVARAFATLGFPAAEPPEVQVLLPLRDEPVRLTLPHTGGVDVLVEGAEDSSRAIGVVLRNADETSWWAPRLEVKQIARAGRARFEHVGLGLELEILAGDHEVELYGLARADGPRTAGETVTVRVALSGPAGTRIAGTVVAEDGTPRAGLAFVPSLADPEARSVRGDVRTDDRGRFEIACASGAASVALELWAGEEGARVPLPSPLPPGRVDVGMVVLRQAPVVCAGRVVDQAGAPLRGAEVCALPRADRSRRVHHQMRGLKKGRRWTTTGESGEFSLRELFDSPLVGVFAEAQGYLPVFDQHEPRGHADVVVVLRRSGAIAGSVLLPDGVPPGRVEVELRDAKGDYVRSTELDADGTFTIDRLAPGPLDAVLQLPMEPPPLARIDGVEIRGGETTRDPRLQQLDLRGVLQPFALAVADAAGRPIQEARVYLCTGDPAQVEFSGYVLPLGRAILATRAPSLDLLVWAPGYRAQRENDVGPGRTVTLPRGLPVAFRLPDGARPPGGDLELVVELLPNAPPNSHCSLQRLGGGSSAGGELPWRDPITAAADASGRAACVLAEPGIYRVRWKLHRLGPTGSEPVATAGSESTIEVSDSGEEQVFAAELGAKELSEALVRTR